MKGRDGTKTEFDDLPGCAREFIKQVIEKMRYRRNVRQDVRAELVSHFADTLGGCETDEQRHQKARQLIEEFGDAKLLAVLLRRAKKRCRPLSQKVLVRMFQVFAVVVLYSLVRVGYLAAGTPNVEVNYVAWLNHFASKGRDPSLNAKPYFDRACELATEGPVWPKELQKVYYTWPGDMNDLQRQVVAEMLEENAEAFDGLKEGLEKPYCWMDYGGQDGLLTEDALNAANTPELRSGLWGLDGFSMMRAAFIQDALLSLAGYRTVALRLAMRSLRRAYEGNCRGAFDDCLALQKFGCRLEGRGLWLEQLVGVAIEALADNRMYTLLEKSDVPVEILNNAQQELEKLYGEQEAIIDFGAEKAFWYDFIQRTFTDDGRGGGRPLIRALPLVAGDWKDGLAGFVSWNYPDRREITKRIDTFFVKAEQLMGRTPYEAGGEDKTDEWGQISEGSFLLSLHVPALRRTGLQVWRVKVGREALVTVLAVTRYWKENGEYPASLGEMVDEGYLSRLPMDPYSDGALLYKRTDDGFLLYSLGANLKDDGGRLGLGRDGRERMWADEGDWVFWPPAD